MGVMEKMRSSTTSILWILIVSFGLLWVLADTQVFDAIGAGPQSMGEVNGEKITFDEYNNRVSSYVDQFNRQTDQTMTPEIRASYEQQAWDDLVTSKLMQQKMNELGITVTDNELVEMITGENPDPFIRQQFQAEDGTIDRIALRAAIEAPENTEVWMMIERQLRESRRQQKMSNYITSGLRISSHDIERQYIQNNSFADAEYVRFPYADVSDSEITVSESELRDYYRNNQDRYQREESYRFRYVSWEIIPTAEDTARVFEDVSELRQEFQEADNDSLFIEQYQSDVPFRNAYVPADDIREDFKPVLELDEGEVSEVREINGDPYLFKKIDERDSEIKFAVLTYKVEADPLATIDRLAEEAGDFSFFANEDGFREEAERRGMTIQEAFATKDNPFIPGLGQSRQILTELERLSRNQISDAIELNDRFVVIQLREKIDAGVRPFDEVSNQIENIVRNEKRREIMAERVEELLSSNNSLEQLAEAGNKEIQIAENVRRSSTVLSGAGREPKVIGAVFRLDENERSGAIKGENAVYVVRPVELTKADPEQMTSNEAEAIRRNLEQQKFTSFNQVWLEELKENANIKDFRSLVLR